VGIHQDAARDESDWTDQDLLTRAEARERLAAECGLIERELAGELDREAASRLCARLAAVVAVLDRMASPSP
jgi:hypothetical protein